MGGGPGGDYPPLPLPLQVGTSAPGRSRARRKGLVETWQERAGWVLISLSVPCHPAISAQGNGGFGASDHQVKAVGEESRGGGVIFRRGAARRGRQASPTLGPGKWPESTMDLLVLRYC